MTELYEARSVSLMHCLSECIPQPCSAWAAKRLTWESGESISGKAAGNVGGIPRSKETIEKKSLSWFKEDPQRARIKKHKNRIKCSAAAYQGKNNFQFEPRYVKGLLLQNQESTEYDTVTNYYNV